MKRHFNTAKSPCIAAMFVAMTLAFGFAHDAAALTPHKKYATEKPDVCNDCHKDLNVALNHGPGWLREHRPYAQKSDSNCKNCHDQSFCVDCHFGGGINADLGVSNFGPDYAPRSHRTGWRELHPLKAKDDPSSCYRCHNDERFCADCHAKFAPEDLSLLSHRKGWSDLQVQSGGPKHSSFTSAQCQQCHPNSLLPKHEWSAQHAREAREDLASCQSCHADGNTCLKCHSATSGLMRSPHPQGWSKIADKMRAASGSKTCNRCHP